MSDWFRLFLDLWPIASGVTPLILLGGFYWLRTKFPTKEDFDALKQTVDGLKLSHVATDNAIQDLHDERDDPPTRVQLMAEMATLAARVSGVEAKVEGVAKQVETANDYLQILIERGVR